MKICPIILVIIVRNIKYRKFCINSKFKEKNRKNCDVYFITKFCEKSKDIKKTIHPCHSAQYGDEQNPKPSLQKMVL